MAIHTGAFIAGVDFTIRAQAHCRRRFQLSSSQGRIDSNVAMVIFQAIHAAHRSMLGKPVIAEGTDGTLDVTMRRVMGRLGKLSAAT